MDTKFFQISVKGLFFRPDSSLMMIQEKKGVWDVPGGRIEKGEDFIECLKRECLEEIGTEPTILEDKPSLVFPAIDHQGMGRIMICYKISFENEDFIKNFIRTNECTAIAFFTKDQMKELDMDPQIRMLVGMI